MCPLLRPLEQIRHRRHCHYCRSYRLDHDLDSCQCCMRRCLGMLLCRDLVDWNVEVVRVESRFVN